MLSCPLLAQEPGKIADSDPKQPTASQTQQIAINSPSYGERNDELWKQMQSTPPDQDREFLMVNLMKFRKKAKYADGRKTDLSGEQANARYAPIKFLGQIGAQIEFVSRVNGQLGNSKPIWDEVGIVRYPSRAKFIGMVTNPEFERKAIHKDAGLEVSQVLVTERVPWKFQGAKRVSDESDSLNLAELIKYREIAEYDDLFEQKRARTGKQAMDLFDTATESLLRKVGAKPVLKTKVIGTLIGDGRTWSEFRLLHFPSLAAYTSYSSGIGKLKGAINHRNAAIEDVYALKVETMSFAKKLALSIATTASGQNQRQPVSTPDGQKQEGP